MKEKKARLLENRENAADMEIRINELRERLQRKKMLNQQLANQLSDASQKNNKVLSQQQQQQQQQQRPSTKNAVSQVAAVEPFNRSQPGAEDDVTDFTASKSDPKYQTLPYNTRFLPMNFHHNNNNNNNNNSSKRGSPTLMKSLKAVASVPPQQVADKPALPPKPAVHYKPLLPPRQNPEKDVVTDASQQSSLVIKTKFFIKFLISGVPQ